MTTRATIQKPPTHKARLEFEPDELLDGRAPIEMMQHDTILYFTLCVAELMDERGETYLMSNNLPVRPYSDNLRISLAPDIFFAYVEDITPFLMETGYNIWQVGKPPDLVVEVASRSTHRKDVNEKPAIYAGMGIPEYWMFDPTGGELYGQALLGYKLVDGEYVPIEITRNEHGLLSGYSEVWRIRLCSVARRQREDILRLQPNLVFYEEAYDAELLIQDPETGLYVMNAKAVSAERRANEAELAAAIAERADAEIQRDAAIAQRDQVQAQRADAEAQRDEAQAQRADAEVQRDQAQAQRDEAQAQRADAEVQRDQAQAQRDEAQAQREADIAERDARIRELEGVIRRMKG